MKYICDHCGFIYDEDAGLPAKGIAPGTAFKNLPEDFECPGCYCERTAFYIPGQKQGIIPPATGVNPRPSEVKVVSDR